MPKIKYIKIPNHLRNFDVDESRFPFQISDDKEANRRIIQALFIEAISSSESAEEKFPGEIKVAKIELNPFKSDTRREVICERYDASECSFKISGKDAHRIANDILDILRNPILMLELLQDLDKQLGEEFARIGVVVEDNSPQYYIAGQGRFVLGPCKPDYLPSKKGRALNRVLLRREQAEGINIEGVATFVDMVPNEEANDFVANGYIFAEDERCGGSVIDHGGKTHRIVFEALRQAAKRGILNLQIASGKILTPKELLEFFVRVAITDHKGRRRIQNLWQFIIDGTGDMCRAAIGKESIAFGDSKAIEALFDFERFCYSSRSPMSLKSLIVCFGDGVGEYSVPNLCFSMRDSHYKQMAQNVAEVRRFCDEFSKALTDKSPIVNAGHLKLLNLSIEESDILAVKAMTDDRLYSYCAAHIQAPEGVSPIFVFRPSPFGRRNAFVEKKVVGDKTQEVFVERYEEFFPGSRTKDPNQPSSGNKPVLIGKKKPPNELVAEFGAAQSDAATERPKDFKTKYESWKEYIAKKQEKEAARSTTSAK